MTVLITGATGFLGPYLMEGFSALDSDVIGVSKSAQARQHDLTDEESVRLLMKDTCPTCVIHAAAMTNVDECEKNPRQAMLVNCVAVRNVVNYLPSGCRFIYISTDMVYSSGKTPHREFSISESPVNVYGLTKYLGEMEACKAPNHLVLRTSFYGLGGGRTSLARQMMERFHRGDIVHLFHDSYFNPLHVTTLRNIIVRAAMMPKIGIYNVGSTGGMSKLKFAALLALIKNIEIGQAQPVSADTFGSIDRAKRPKDTRMDISRFEQSFGIPLPRMELDMLNLKDEAWTP